MNENVINFKPKKEIGYPDDDFEGVIFRGDEDKPILMIRNTGEITWNSPKGKVNIQNEELLGVALIGIIAEITGGVYDYTVLSDSLWDKYINFLRSYKSSILEK